MTNLLQVGQPAPEFTATDRDNNALSLSDFLGNWLILYFYPKDNTPGCTTEAKEFTARTAEFYSLNARVVGVSPDSVKSHARFQSKHNLSITLLSDPEHQIATAYGVWQLKKFMGKEYMGVVRSTFLINPEGALAYIWSKVKVKGHVAEVLAQLRELVDRPQT